MTTFSDTLIDFFGDGENCVNCGEDYSGDGWCRACSDAGETGSAYRQMAYRERIGDERGAASVRKWITEHTAKMERAEQAWQRALAHRASHADLRLIVSVGWGRDRYDDPESNAPTGVDLIRDEPPGDPYADQIGLEERAPSMRL